MKLGDRQSTNVETRARDFPRPMSGTRIGGESIHSNDAQAYDTWGKQRIKATLNNKDSPFNPMVKGMDAAAKQDQKDTAAARARGINSSIPIPTERPDPSQPYEQPTVFTGRDTKG